MEQMIVIVKDSVAPINAIITDPGAFAGPFGEMELVESYEEMLQAANGLRAKIILVAVDEEKSLTNTMYAYYPDKAIMWIAANLEVDLNPETE